MINLPYDYSRCIASQCAIKETCARFTSPSRPDGLQSFCDFSLGDACGNFISNVASPDSKEKID